MHTAKPCYAKPQLYWAASLLALTLLCLIMASCSSNSLEHGYRLVQRSETSGGFEGRAHYKDLYFHQHRLGEVGQYSISPSGRYALFEDNGKLQLFDRTNTRTRDVTDGSFAIPKSFNWRESAGIVEVVYYEGHTNSTIQLPR